jgi:hypothetical protein
MTVPTTSFAEFLNARRIDDEKILVALRYYVAELTDDKLPDELRADVVDQVGDAGRVDEALRRLSADRPAEVAAALAFFSAQWDDPAERERIARAFEGSGTKLPVIEAGLIAMVSMYGMFMIATLGRKSSRRTTRRGTDGSFEETVEEEWWGPTGPLRTLVDLMRPGGKSAASTPE